MNKLTEKVLIAVAGSYYAHLLYVRAPHALEYGVPFDVSVDMTCMTWLSVSTVAMMILAVLETFGDFEKK